MDDRTVVQQFREKIKLLKILPLARQSIASNGIDVSIFVFKVHLMGFATLQCFLTVLFQSFVF